MFGIRKSCSCVCLQQVSRRTYARTTKSHYESLGLSAKASQTDIKKAYYKLSMQYHPDKVAGDEVKFREITAAYEVLGNVKLRKLYDQGVIRVERGQAPSAEDLAKAPHTPPPPESKFYRSRVPTSGRTQVYNFDEWSRMHYQKTRARDQEKRTTNEERARRQAEFVAQSKSELALWLCMFCMVALVVGTTTFSHRSYDKPSRRPPKEDS